MGGCLLSSLRGLMEPRSENLENDGNGPGSLHGCFGF